MLILKLFALISLACLVLQPIEAQISTFRMSNFYSNEMVLQRAPKSAAIWGYGQPGAEVRISYESNQISATVGDDEKWTVVLPPHDASEMIDFAVQQFSDFGMITIPFKAMFGDVWVCSGQSNMAMPIKNIFNPAEEAEKAIQYQNFRLLKAAHNYSLEDLEDEMSYVHTWSAPTAENVPEFSAICIMFAERLSDFLGSSIPFGLIEISWPGTRIEAWASPRAIEACSTPANNESNHNSNSALWNGMVHPLLQASAKGAIWYQGESNINVNRELYSCHLENMINDWRTQFFEGEVVDEFGNAFPFGILQNGPNWRFHNYNWGEVRWQQTLNYGFLPTANAPEAFFAATYDLTDHTSPTSSIHPRDKQTTADRLANSAKSLMYDATSFSTCGPTPIGIEEVAAGIWTVTYDRNIKIVGAPGFAYKLPDESHELINITSSTSNSVTVSIDPSATHLVYAFSSYVCEYKDCVVYSDDDENLPAQPWTWLLT